MALAGTETAGTIPEHCKSVSFAPAHVSLTFTVWPDEDPLKMGSTGIGLVLPQGVHCAVVDEQSESSENVVICGGKQIKDPVTLRALELIGFGNQGLTIYLRRDLPLGFGLGISGSSSLAACLELEKDFEKSVKAAHQAEVEYKTGLGDVMAISASLKENIFPSIVIRESPGYGGEIITYPVKDKMVICLSGLGRDTSQILNNSEWTEIINTASLGIQLTNVNLRTAIKTGRLFTEKAGLMNENLSEILEQVPMGAVASVAHLGTSIVATSDDVLELRSALENFGEIREF